MTRFTATARTTVLLTLVAGFLTFVAAFLALTLPAFAAGDDDLPQATLNVAHTDFTSAKSVAQLKHRVRRKAYSICTANSDSRTLMSADQRRCYVTAMTGGLAQIEDKRLAALRQTWPDMAAAQPVEPSTR